MICKFCGKQLSEGINFCSKCGKSVNESGSIEDMSFETASNSASSNNLPAEKESAPSAEHPAKNFMWSVALAGPLIAWICHRKEINKGQHSFFWPLFGWSFLLDIPDKILTHLSGASSNIDIFTIIGIIWWIATIVILGKIGASRMKLCCPNYDSKSYKSKERIGIIIGVIIGAISFTALFCVGFLEGLEEAGY